MPDNNLTSLVHSRSIAVKLYMDWLKYHNVLDYFTQPTTVPNIYYQKNWQPITQNVFELILSFLSSMNYFTEAGGTFVIKENYKTRLSNLENTINLPILITKPIYRYIKYGLSLFDEILEGGTGQWVKTNYLLIEQYYNSGIYRDLYNIMIEYLFEFVGDNKRVIKNIGVFGLFHELSVNSFVKNNLKPSKIRLLTYNKKLKRLIRSYCELTTSSSHFSNSIRMIGEETDFKADIILLPNGIGCHYNIQQLASLIDNHANEKCTIIGISSFKFDTYLGIEPLLFFQPDFKEMPEEKNIEKFLITKGFSKFEKYNGNELIFKSVRK